MGFTTYESETFYKMFHKGLIEKVLSDVKKAQKEGNEIKRYFLKKLIHLYVSRKEHELTTRMNTEQDDCAILIRDMIDSWFDECRTWQTERKLLKDIKQILKKEQIVVTPIHSEDDPDNDSDGSYSDVYSDDDSDGEDSKKRKEKFQKQFENFAKSLPLFPTIEDSF